MPEKPVEHYKGKILSLVVYYAATEDEGLEKTGSVFSVVSQLA